MRRNAPSLGSMARPASPHRRPPSPRVVCASALLLLCVAACAATLLGAPDRAAAALPAVTAAGLVAALLLRSQLRAERVEHATDRLAQAHAFTETYLARSAEHTAYADNAGRALHALRRQVRELEGTLRLAEARGDEAEHRLREERGRLLRAEVRLIELEVALERRASDQIDELAAWPRDDVDTVVDLLSWDQRHEGLPTPRTA